MKNLMITEMNLAARLFQSGIMKYFDQEELNLYMTDFCYYSKPHDYNRDKDFIKEMILQEQIKIIGLNEAQVDRASILMTKYYPKFRIKTIAAMVIANENNYSIVSEDELVREITYNDFAVNAYDKKWLVDFIISSLNNKNYNISADMLRLVI